MFKEKATRNLPKEKEKKKTDKLTSCIFKCFQEGITYVKAKIRENYSTVKRK